MVTGAEERSGNESFKFGGTGPDNIFIKTSLQDSSGSPVSPTNPLPVTSVSHTSKDLEGGGKISVGTTAVEVTFTETTESIIITADSANTGILYIGKSDVTNTGANALTFLKRYDSVTLDYDDVDNALYVVSDTTSQNFFKGALK